MAVLARRPTSSSSVTPRATVHMSEDGGDSWTRIADEVGCVTKGNHAAGPPRRDQAPRRCGGGAIKVVHPF